jgi:hypothetical protein
MRTIGLFLIMCLATLSAASSKRVKKLERRVTALALREVGDDASQLRGLPRSRRRGV